MPKKIIDHNDQEARAYNWVLLATFILLISLVIQTPARLAARFLPAHAQTAISAWGGSLWSGQVNGHYKTWQGQLTWQLKPLSLLRLKIGVDWALITAQSHAHGELYLGLNGWQLAHTQGQLAATDIQSLLSGWQLPNMPIAIENISLDYQKKQWQQAAGLLSWQGGELDYVFNGQRQHVNLPPVRMTVSAEKDALVMTLNEQQGANLANFVLTGMNLESRLTQRLLAYSPSYRGVAEPDAIVVTATQPISSL